MPAQTTQPKLTERFDDALRYAAKLHRTQIRKGGDIPYLGNLLSTASLVVEAGGTETQAIAALLHDAVEDQGGPPVLAEIERRFGPDVAKIVDECSDTDVVPKPPWEPRKQAYIDHLHYVSEATILVSLADKVDNARALLRDYQLDGDEVWQRFSVHEPHKHLWYFRALHAIYRDKNSTWLVDELDRVLGELENLVAASPKA